MREATAARLVAALAAPISNAVLKGKYLEE